MRGAPAPRPRPSPPACLPACLPALPRLPLHLAQAAELSIANAYGALVSQEGGVGLNAATSHDATK